MAKRNPDIVNVEPYWYDENDCLGSGQFGDVFKGHSDQDKNLQLAIKRIPKTILKQKEIKREIQILQELSGPDVQHENIVALLDCIQTDKDVYLIMEYCNGGDLDKYLKHFAEKGKMDEPSLKEFLQQIADFGIGRFLDEGAAAQTFCGTLVFMAPEIFFPNAQYDYKVDLWSVGAIVYNCFTGTLHGAFENKEIRFPSNTSPNLKDLLTKLLCNDPKTRLSFDDFYCHPFIGMTEIEKKQKRDSSREEIVEEKKRDRSSIDSIVRSPSTNEVDYGYVTIAETELNMSMLGLGDDRKQAKMPCGHIIGRDSMTKYCRDVLQKGQFQFFCPFPGSPPCNTHLEYFIVRNLAQLTAEEFRELETKISNNYLMKARGMQRCPGCQNDCNRGGVGAVVRCPFCTKNNGENFDFCWWCQGKWLNSSFNPPCGNPGCDGEDKRLSILATCPTKKINKCENCPRVRGCPKCGILIEHMDESAHMNYCGNCHEYGFCFICLKRKKNGKWQCSPYSGTCVLQPRQTNLPGSK